LSREILGSDEERRRLGHLALQRGDLAGAAEAFAEDLAIARRLATLDPSNFKWQQDLIASLSIIGQLRRAQGDAEGARQALAEAVAVARQAGPAR
jgi:hypothetical protein